MPNLILIKNMSFKYEASFDKLELKDIIVSIKDKLEFIPFEKTIELMKKIQELFGIGINNIMNCIYNDKHVIQAIYRDNDESPTYDQMVFIKREINEHDSYTFGEFSADNDPYKYVDVLLLDIADIIRKKHINDAVYVNSDGRIDDIEFIDIVESDNTGSLHIKHKKDIKNIKYINSVNISHKLSEKNEASADELQEKLKEEMDKHSADYIFTKKGFGLGSLNYFCQGVGFSKNEIVSELLSTPNNQETITGDVIICLENILNDDARILSMNKELFNKLRTFIKTIKPDFVPKNKFICNLYYELM